MEGNHKLKVHLIKWPPPKTRRVSHIYQQGLEPALINYIPYDGPEEPEKRILYGEIIADGTLIGSLEICFDLLKEKISQKENDLLTPIFDWIKSQVNHLLSLWV